MSTHTNRQSCHCVLAMFVRPVTRASITAGRQNNLSSLHQRRTDRKLSFRPNQWNSEPKPLRLLPSFCTCTFSFFLFLSFFFSIDCQIAPCCRLLFNLAWEFRCIISANNFGKGLCFHSKLAESSYLARVGTDSRSGFPAIRVFLAITSR